MNQQEKALYLSISKDVLNWKIKTLARSPREMMITQSIFIAVYLTGSTLFIWGGWIMFSDSLYSLVGTILALAGILAYYLCLLIRQKTIYNYTITTNHALVEYYLHYPD
ncbi:permease, partial [Pseudomonas syringae pv. tagetis]